MVRSRKQARVTVWNCNEWSRTINAVFGCTLRFAGAHVTSTEVTGVPESPRVLVLAIVTQLPSRESFRHIYQTIARTEEQPKEHSNTDGKAQESARRIAPKSPSWNSEINCRIGRKTKRSKSHFVLGIWTSRQQAWIYHWFASLRIICNEQPSEWSQPFYTHSLRVNTIDCELIVTLSLVLIVDCIDCWLIVKH